MIESAGRVTRRAFLSAAAGGAAALAAACRDAAAPDLREPGARLFSRPWRPVLRAPVGVSSLGLHDRFTGRDGLLYVPPSYSPAVGLPLILALHGAYGSSLSWTNPEWLRLLDEYKAVMLAPDSRSFSTWDLLEQGAYGRDVAFMDEALGVTYRQVNVVASRIAILGFSDGATEALGLGLMNGDLFNGVVAFSPGGMFAPFARGHTRAFVSHGTDDRVLSYTSTRDGTVPAIESLGVPVQWAPFTGGHTIPDSTARAALTYALSGR